MVDLTPQILLLLGVGFLVANVRSASMPCSSGDADRLRC